MTWVEHEPWPEYPGLVSLHAGNVHVTVRAYMLGQHRVQVVYGGTDILSPEL